MRMDLPMSQEMTRRLRAAAAMRGINGRRYILDAIESRLSRDLGQSEEDGFLRLTAKADPVLAGVWAQERDSAYDRL